MLWLQGRENAPEIVEKCISSWEYHNPEWEVRCLDSVSLQHYVDIGVFIDLETQNITRTSFSDIARIALLHEYGGVWADATTVCNTPLDEWLPDVMEEGFFAFKLKDFPQGDRPVASWFLAAKPSNLIIVKWAKRISEFWKNRESTDDYFWFHHQFYELLETDALFKRDWDRVPKLSADGPHSIQFKHRCESLAKEVVDNVDWSTPLFKLTYRIDPEYLKGETLLNYLMKRNSPNPKKAMIAQNVSQSNKRSASLSVSTQNCGDHLQIIAGSQMMSRIGMNPDYFIDRDNDILTAESLPSNGHDIPILLNGWFKTNRIEWPPNEKFNPVFVGFHIRLHQCPELLSEEALDYYKKYEPIGCRDIYTHNLLKAKGVKSYVSNCLTLIFPRRISMPETQTKVFVVSRDERIMDHIPQFLGNATFINHYSDVTDFEANSKRMSKLLESYKSEAKLIVTTLLHCALPAIAMGIPVVVIYPHNSDKGHISDQQRFSSLERLVRVYNFEKSEDIDWRGHTVDVSAQKLSITESFLKMSAKWQVDANPIGPFAESSSLPVPKINHWQNRRITLSQKYEGLIANVEKWGSAESYKPDWQDRAEIAASMIPSDVSVFEIGVGAGDFARLIKERVEYKGSDLAPLSSDLLKLNIDNDEIPSMKVDYAVFLGVFEYLKNAHNSALKITRISDNIICTYCCRNDGVLGPDIIDVRRSRGWVTDYTKAEFLSLFEAQEFSLIDQRIYNSASDFTQFVLHFKRLNN